jgi:hypothetical protein
MQQDTEKLSAAIDVLLDQLKEQQQELDETKKTINMLKRRMGQPPMFTDIGGESTTSGSLQPDSYYGKPLATSVQAFLERDKRALLPEEILRGLEQGGFDFRSVAWKDTDRLRSFAIALSKNPKFHRLPNGRYGLTAWYDEAVLKRSSEKKANGEKPLAEDPGPSENEDEATKE